MISSIDRFNSIKTLLDNIKENASVVIREITDSDDRKALISSSGLNSLYGSSPLGNTSETTVLRAVLNEQ